MISDINAHTQTQKLLQENLVIALFLSFDDDNVRFMFLCMGSLGHGVSWGLCLMFDLFITYSDSFIV